MNIFNIFRNGHESKNINLSSLKKDELIDNIKELHFLTPINLATFF